MNRTCTTLVAALVFLASTTLAQTVPPGWERHTIDEASGALRGADGVTLGDLNRDGLPDIVTGWEQGNAIRVALNPSPAAAEQPWPSVTVGAVSSAEDAVFADLDGDGVLEVVSCTEGRTRTVFFHWAPEDPARLLSADAWQTSRVPATAGEQMWMFAEPLQIDGANGIDLVLGSKGRGATVGWLRSPQDARDAAAWRYHPLRPAGWVMSLLLRDMDGDGDEDVLVSDRKGGRRGVCWLENPGPAAAQEDAPWREHAVGGADVEVMFLDMADLDGDGVAEILCAGRTGHMLLFTRAAPGEGWTEARIPNPFGARWGKAARIADMNGDGHPDIVHTANSARERDRPGVAWLEAVPGSPPDQWPAHSISGPQGAKFDLVELLDLDADGDIDIIACEEVDQLGVFWYENPGH